MKPPPDLAAYAKDPPEADDGALVKVRTLKQWAARIIRLIPRPSRGLSVRRSLDGDVWLTSDLGGGGSCEYSWTPNFIENDGGGNDIVRLNVGTLNDSALITLDDAGGGGDTDILELPTLAIPDDALQIIYLEVTGATTKTANDFVTGFSVATATIEVGTSLPASSQTVRRLELFRWYAGALFNQSRRYNLHLDCRDDGSSSNVGVFTFLPGA